MSSVTCVEGTESMTGAMDRASHMPDSRSEVVDNNLWDEGNVWTGDWGKWEDHSKDKK